MYETCRFVSRCHDNINNFIVLCKSHIYLCYRQVVQYISQILKFYFCYLLCINLTLQIDGVSIDFSEIV